MQPSFFIPHGGGPCFFMDWTPPDTWKSMAQFLAGFLDTLAEKPKAIVLLTAHWEAAEITLSTNPAPDLLFDYYGFPQHTYELTWPAPGAPDLALRAAALLADAGIRSAFDNARGYDHGVFIPMKVARPAADIPVVMMSLRADLDAQHHFDAGAALAPLRDEGVLIIGSGMSYHNMNGFRAPGIAEDLASSAFDSWLTEVVEGPPDQRGAALADWAEAPGARASHPREEHLAPVFLAAGAAGASTGQRVWGEHVNGIALSAYRFG